MDNPPPPEKRPGTLAFCPALQGRPGPGHYPSCVKEERGRSVPIGGGGWWCRETAGVWKRGGAGKGRGRGVGPQLAHPSATHMGISIRLTCTEGLFPSALL